MKNNEEQATIRFRDLSLPVKIGIIGGITYIVLFIIGFLFGILVSITGGNF